MTVGVAAVRPHPLPPLPAPTGEGVAGARSGSSTGSLLSAPRGEGLGMRGNRRDRDGFQDHSRSLPPPVRLRREKGVCGGTGVLPRAGS